MRRCVNGKAFVKSLVPIVVSATPSTTAQTYMLNLDYFLCGNRKVCINGSYPITAQVTFTPGNAVSLGNNNYSIPVTVTGQVTYKPYVPGCSCVCPKTEAFSVTIDLPAFNSSSVPTANVATATAIAAPEPVEECCSLTNQLSIQTTIAITES